MAPISGFYAIYDEQSQGVKLVDDQGFEEVKASVTSGKPNIDSIDYEKCRDIMRFKPIVIRRRKLAPPQSTDLVAVYEPSNQSMIAITRADYEKNKSKYDQGPAPTLKPRPAELAPAPTLTPAFTDAAPIEKPKLEAKPAPSTNDDQITRCPIRNFTNLIFQPPKIGPVELSPEDLVAVYDSATQSTIAVKRSQHEGESTLAPAVAPTLAPAVAPTPAPAVTPTPAPAVATTPAPKTSDLTFLEPALSVASAPAPTVAAQKTSDLIFQAPKVGPIKLCPDDLLAVYDPESQGVILVTRKQYDQGKTSKAPVTAASPQSFANLIFQPPKIGPIKLSPDDLLAVYQPELQEVVLVTRKQYDAGESTTATASVPAPTPAPKVTAQKTSDLIFQAPKVGPIKLCPDDLLAVYDPDSQGVILVTRKQYDQGKTPATPATAVTPQSFANLIFQPPKIGPIKLSPDDLLAVYQPELQEVVLVTRKQYEAGEIPKAAPQSFASLIFQPPKIGPISYCPDDLLAVYQPESQEVVLVTRRQFDAGEIPAVARQSFINLIFQPPKVGPVVLGDEDLIAVYEPETQSVITVTRKEFNKM